MRTARNHIAPLDGSTRLEVEIVACEEGSLSVASGAPVVVVTSAGAPKEAIEPMVLDMVGLRFIASSRLACIVLVEASPPAVVPFGLVVPDATTTRVLALALRREVVDVGLEALPRPGGDPLLEVVERLVRAWAGVEWRSIERGASLEDGLLAQIAWPLPSERWFEPEWQELWSVRTPDGGHRVDTRLALVTGEEVECPLALVRRDPFPSAVPLLADGAAPERYPSEPTESSRVVGYLRTGGLPGGVALMLFHDPRANVDRVGLAGEERPGWHPSRLLGWAMQTPSALWERGFDRTLPGRLSLIIDENSEFEARPAGQVREGATTLGTIHAEPRASTRPLYAARSRGRSVLTVEPSQAGLADVAHLGYVEGRARTGLEPLSADGLEAGLAIGYVEPARETRVRGRTLAGPSPVPPLSLSRRLRRQAKTVAMRGGRQAARRSRSSTRTRTLLVVPWLSVGGADHFLLGMAEALAGRGHEMHALLTYPASDSPVENRDAFRPHLAGLTCSSEDRPGEPLWKVADDLIRRHGIDQILLCGGHHLYEELPRLRALSPGLRVVDQLFNDFGHLAANRRHAAFIDLTICAYEGLRRQLVDELGEDPARVERVYIGIDVNRFTPPSPEERRTLKSSLGFDSARPLWGYVGRISEEKCLHNLVEAFKRIAGRHDAQLLIHGEGPAREQVGEAVARSSLDVALRPFAPDVRPTLKALDAYVLPSRVEGIPLALMEAMACGTLAIASAVGGVPELVVDGMTGFLTTPRDPGSVAIALLAAARLGPAERDEMRSRARATVRGDMSWSDTVGRYAELLERR